MYSMMGIIHLLFCYLEKETWRKKTKPIIMFILLAMIIGYGIEKGISVWFVLLAVVASCIGDMILLFDEKQKLFLVGGFFFFLGYLFYLIQIIVELPFTVPWYFYVLTLFFLGVWLAITYPKMKSTSQKISIWISIYSFILVVGIAFSCITILIKVTLGNFLIFFGFLTFMISNTILVYSIYIHQLKRCHFYRMLSYVIAQALLVIGILL